MGRRAAIGLGGRGDRELIPLRSTGRSAESVRYTDRSYGPIAQLVERLAGSQKVRGSNPLGSTFSSAREEREPTREFLSARFGRDDNRVVVPLIFVVTAFALVAVLMLIMMRVRWNDGSRPGWEPNVAPQPKPLPRAYGTLIVVGYLVLVPGVVLAAVFRAPALVFVCVLTLYAATWVSRIALVRWRDANTSV